MLARMSLVFHPSYSLQPLNSHDLIIYSLAVTFYTSLCKRVTRIWCYFKITFSFPVFFML